MASLISLTANKYLILAILLVVLSPAIPFMALLAFFGIAVYLIEKGG